MKKLLTPVFLVCCLVSCNKKSDTPPNNNEFNATVVFSTGDRVTINAQGKAASIGSSPYAGVTYVSGINENGAGIFLNVFPIITTPGTYSFSCEFRQNINEPNTAIYGGMGGNITFTVIDAQTMKGFFTNVTCKCISPPHCINNVDSLVVSGSFFADHLN